MDMKVSRHPSLPKKVQPENISWDEQDQALINLIQAGLPICATPYAELGKQLDMDETEVLARLQRLNSSNVIKRFGVVVRHHELGYRSNGMIVWNIPDENVSELGMCMGQFDFVTLCYRRPRRLPEWSYNLFTMIHGQDRDDVLKNIQFLIKSCNLDEINYEVLFSTRRFKQRGAIYNKVNTQQSVV